MAWAYEQRFNSLTPGDLNGQDSWSGSAVFDVSTSSPIEGSQSILASFSSAQGAISRAITPVTSGTVYMSFNMAQTNAGNQQVKFYSGSTLAFFIRFNASGNIVAFGGAGTTIQAYAANTVYRLGITFDCGTDTFTVSVNNGTPSSSIAFDSPVSSIDKIEFEQPSTATATWRFDYISPTYSITSNKLLLLGIG